MTSNPTIETLNKKLQEIETFSKTDENQIYKAIKTLEVSRESPCNEFLWELYAFGFYEFGVSKNKNFEPFEPMCTWADGQEYPSAQLLKTDTITYWKERAKTSVHPVLRARYAELVWVFGKSISSKPEVSNVPIFIEAVLEMLQNDRYSEDYRVEISDKLTRSLRYALLTNKLEWVDKIKSAIINFDKRYICRYPPRLSVFSFDVLVGDTKHRKHLTDAEEKDIVSELNSKFDKIVIDANNRVGAESIAKRLADYYRGKNDLINCKNVVSRFCSVMEHRAEKASSEMLAYFCYQKKAAEFSNFYQFKDLSEKFMKFIRDTSPSVIKEMQPMKFSMQISQQELEEFYELFLQGDKNEALQRIADHFILSKKCCTDQVKKLDQQFIMRQIFSTQPFNYDGLQTANINPDDEEGKTIHEAMQILQFRTPFLHDVLHRVIEKYNLHDMDFIEFLERCSLFVDNTEILKLGFVHYLKNDHCSAIHLFIPQIERAIRHMVDFLGSSTLKERTGGGYHQHTLDTLLRNQPFIDFWGEEDIPWYLRIVLTDQRGLNLRNDICHGLRPYRSFRSVEADLLIHILFVLATCDIVNLPESKTK